MKNRLLLLMALGLTTTVLFLSGCSTPAAQTSFGGYEVIQSFAPSTQEPVTIGQSAITFEPAMAFPPGSVQMYQLCIKDISKLNNIDENT